MKDNIKNDRYILNKKILIFKNKYLELKKSNSIDEIELRECICDILSWIEICVKTTKNMNL